MTELNVSTTPVPALGHGQPIPDPEPEFPYLVPQSEMTATATSEQAGYEAKLAIDGVNGHLSAAELNVAYTPLTSLLEMAVDLLVS